MSNVSPFRAAPAFDSETFDAHRVARGEGPEPEPMPETKTRRTIKNTKRRIAWLTKQIRAEQKRIALRNTARDLEAQLDDLRKDKADF